MKLKSNFLSIGMKMHPQSAENKCTKTATDLQGC